MGLLDLTGPLTVFLSTTLFMEQQGLHGYARHTVSLDGSSVAPALSRPSLNEATL